MNNTLIEPSVFSKEVAAESEWMEYTGMGGVGERLDRGEWRCNTKV